MAQGPQVAFLHGILGVRGIAQKIARECERVVKMRQCGVAKTPHLDVLVVGIACHRVVPGHPPCRGSLHRSRIKHHCPAPSPASTTIVPVMCG